VIRGVCLVSSPAAGFRRETKEDRWPEIFAALPRVGDWVKSSSGTRAKVVGVTHCTVNNPTVIGLPAIEVEICL
jgi:hypothetical protein